MFAASNQLPNVDDCGGENKVEADDDVGALPVWKQKRNCKFDMTSSAKF